MNKQRETSVPWIFMTHGGGRDRHDANDYAHTKFADIGREAESIETTTRIRKQSTKRAHPEDDRHLSEADWIEELDEHPDESN